MTRTTLAVSLVVAAAGCSKTPSTTTPAPAEPAPTAAAPASAPASAPMATMPAAPARGDDTDRKSKNGVLEATVSGVPVRVQYGRPHVNGRTVFGELIPYGEVWRTGADEATTLSLAKDATVAGEPVAAGTYALFTIPGKDGWKIVLNTVAQQWGAYKIDRSKDVVVADVAATAHDATEVMTFTGGDSGLVLTWADTAVTIPISAR
ncbi:MAG: DUF2911 domain-containing protein [Myxococcota bacterium]